MPIPKNAKRVFKGEIFDVYQWKQKMFDGSFKTFESIKRQDTVIVITSMNNKIVVIKQKQPGGGWYYGEPSGRMDKKGESPKAAAARELLEETGLLAKKLFLWKKVQQSRKIQHINYIFIAKNCRKAAKQQLDNGEKIKIELMGFEDWLKLSDNPKYIYGTTLVDMLRARLHKTEKQKLKKLIFG